MLTIMFTILGLCYFGGAIYFYFIFSTTRGKMFRKNAHWWALSFPVSIPVAIFAESKEG